MDNFELILVPFKEEYIPELSKILASSYLVFEFLFILGKQSSFSNP
jgi:hypothetical protein